MGVWKQYAICVIVCLFICRILSQLISDPRRKKLIFLISGTVLATALLQPFTVLDLMDGIPFSVPDQDPAMAYVEEGERAADEIRCEYIKKACEAYILNKAESLGIQVRVQITLNQKHIPVFAEICGHGDTASKDLLQSILTEDLGISKENQAWIWNQENSGSSLP